jgi:hypothetical protein
VGDEAAALAVWMVGQGSDRQELEARRTAVKRSLASQSPRAYRIERGASRRARE